MSTAELITNLFWTNTSIMSYVSFVYVSCLQCIILEYLTVLSLCVLVYVLMFFCRELCQVLHFAISLISIQSVFILAF